MRISGIQKFTVLDYPEKTACILFTPGCNFRCGYCHNPEFVLPERLKSLEPHLIAEDDVLRFLESRKYLLDGVVITGGEPTLQRDLPSLMRKVKVLGFSVKLDTNGSLPEILEPILAEGLADYVAMDVKTSLARYPELVGACVRPEAIAKSIELIKALAPDYEFRTTIVSEHHGPAEIEGMRSLVAGARRYVLQGFRPDITLDPAFGSYRAVGRGDLETLVEEFRPAVAEVLIR